jgi:hypothetical protein
VAAQAFFGAGSSFEPFIIVYAPRIWLACASLVGDLCIYRIARIFGLGGWSTVVAASLTWSGTLLVSRPFSNTLEHFWMIALMAVVAEATQLSSVLSESKPNQAASLWRLALLQTAAGAILVCGVFTRFTFVLFAIAPGLLMVVLAVLRGLHRSPLASSTPILPGEPLGREAVAASDRKDKGVDGELHRRRGLASSPASRRAAGSSLLGGAVSWARVWESVGLAALQALVGAGFSVVLLVAVDTAVYKSDAPVFAPWENFVYNLDPRNLALHGTHPRWLHAVVNAPLMLGVLYPAAVGIVADQLWLAATSSTTGWAAVLRRHSKGCGVQPSILQSVEGRRCIGQLMAAGSLVASLAGLSSAPHQEPRFLLPCLLPASLLAGEWVVTCAFSCCARGPSGPALKPQGLLVRRACGALVWLLWGALLLWFGCLHQAGLLRAVPGLRSSLAPKTAFATTGFHVDIVRRSGTTTEWDLASKDSASVHSVPITAIATVGTFRFPLSALALPASNTSDRLAPLALAACTAAVADAAQPATARRVPRDRLIPWASVPPAQIGGADDAGALVPRLKSFHSSSCGLQSSGGARAAMLVLSAGTLTPDVRDAIDSLGVAMTQLSGPSWWPHLSMEALPARLADVAAQASLDTTVLLCAS